MTKPITRRRHPERSVAQSKGLKDSTALVAAPNPYTAKAVPFPLTRDANADKIRSNRVQAPSLGMTRPITRYCHSERNTAGVKSKNLKDTAQVDVEAAK